MTERIDHAAEAKVNLATIADMIQGMGRVSLAETIAVAQVQATLALAEQQHVANLQTERSVQAARTQHWNIEVVEPAAQLFPVIEQQIREGLGL